MTDPTDRHDATAATEDADPFHWLEAVDSDAALTWVRERNAASRAVLEAWPAFAETRDAIRANLDSPARIPYFTRRADWLYNLWRDADHPRGLWRRATLAEYRQADPAWETVIDLDALAGAEGENWVWAGATSLGPDHSRCLVSLSRGGADAAVVREFDTATKAFVAGGFALPEAKTEVEWLSADAVYVGTDCGAGSLTDSGYPRQIRLWCRGQPLADAPVVFEARQHDVSASVSVDRTPGYHRTVFSRAIDFYNTERWLAAPDGLRRIDLPTDATLKFWRDRVLVALRSDWSVGGEQWPAGALLVGDAQALLDGRPDFEPLFTPTASRSLADFSTSRSVVLLNVLDDVAGRVEEWRCDGGRWCGRTVDTPRHGALSATALQDSEREGDDPLAEAYTLVYTDFLTPESLLFGRTGSDDREPLKARPALFDTAGMTVEQRFARSADGTRVPYFIVWPAGAKPDTAGGAPAGGPRPTLLHGYGGFEVSRTPWYSAAFGSAWYGRGGVLAVANIRGGGEYGPGWHQAAVQANKQRSYDDFAAVAGHLIAGGVTDAAHLGIQGGSNGGLLVGAVMLQRPELFAAVVCQVPLLDMRRYHRLLAGASWMAEYGDPDDPAQWAWISRYSPYQNLRPGLKLPRVLFTTSTRDDRVHPGHARKMAAKMAALGHAPLYVENIEGGHGGAADNAQLADMLALEFAFLWQQLGR